MNSQRIEMLKKLILEEPTDAFYPYAMALELIQVQREEALAMLMKVLEQFPTYLPAYYQAALLQIEKGDIHKGEEILNNGIELAKQQQDRKAMSELRTLLDSI